MNPYWISKEATLYHGDCRVIMPDLNENSVDSIVTDPPYHLTTGRKGGSGEASRPAPGNPYGKSYAPTGFMGKSWDGGDVAFQPATWEKAYRLLKPGGYLLAMGGTRTYHRLVCAIEDAGFEIRDSIAWVYGSGFPKSLDISKAIDKAARGVPQGGSDPTSENHGNYKGGCSEDNPDGRGFGAGPGKFMKDGRSKYDGANRKYVPSTTNGFGYESKGLLVKSLPLTNEAQRWEGWGTALKPAMELIVVARKPLSELTVASNVLRYGTGALNIDGCRIPHDEECKMMAAQTDDEVMTGGGKYGQAGRRVDVLELKPEGRWPANLIHDGSDEVLDEFNKYGDRPACMSPSKADSMGTIFGGSRTQGNLPMDEGTAARFFYCAKASQEDRNEGCEHIPPTQYSYDGRETPIDNAYQRNASNASNASNAHPTVKPTALMRYLVKLVTPPNGIVLDPFNGSGSTGKAALYEGFKYIGIEGEQEYLDISKARIQFVMDNDSPLFR